MTASLADKEFAPRIVLFITREEDGHRLEAAQPVTIFLSGDKEHDARGKFFVGQ